MEGRHIAISGVMGAGKTTLVRGLAGALDFLALEERFDENPFLGSFYADPSTWAFRSYVFFLERTFADYSRARAAARGGVQERVLEEHLVVFGAEFRARGYLDADEFALLEALTLDSAAALPVPDLLLHVDVDPELALERLRARATPAEREVELDYLVSLDARYDSMLGAWDGELLRLDAGAEDFRDRDYVAGLAVALGERLGVEA
jgi:deoxyadenosine/deoxycytidine kinase